MPSELSRTQAYLFDIRDNILHACRFIEGFAYERFRDDVQVFYAVTRALEIISEASRRLPAEMKERHSHIPWTDVAAAGNVYRHEYEDVRERAVWVTVQRDLPELLAVVESELLALDELP